MVVLVLVACGAGGTAHLTPGDKALGKQISDSFVDVVGSLEPLLSCKTASACGPEVTVFSQALDRHTSALDAAIRRGHDSCLRAASSLYLRALRAFKAFAIAVRGNDTQLQTQASDEAGNLMDQSVERLLGCQFMRTQTPSVKLVVAATSSLLDLGRLWSKLYGCQTYDCLSNKGEDIETATDQALKRLTPLLAEVKRLGPCHSKEAQLIKRIFNDYRDVGVRAQEGDANGIIAAFKSVFSAEIQANHQSPVCAAGLP